MAEYLKTKAEKEVRRRVDEEGKGGREKDSLEGSVIGIVEQRSHTLSVHVVLSGEVEVLVGVEEVLI